MAVFLPVRAEGKTLFDGKFNLYQAKTLDAHRIPAPGAWPHDLPCRGHPATAAACRTPRAYSPYFHSRLRK